MDDDDDIPVLAPSALAALQEFYLERDTREKQFEDLKVAAEDDFDDQAPIPMELFGESWQDSQFWYSDATATTLAEQLLDGVTEDSRIAVVSAPTVYVKLRNLLLDREKYPIRPKLTLLEFDERFNVFKGDFVMYDFKQPLKLDSNCGSQRFGVKEYQADSRVLESLKGSFDRIICDPPFLSDECQTKAALTVRWLAKSWSCAATGPSDSSEVPLRFILCTGERMETLARKLYGKAGTKTTTFYPEHSNPLSNEFRCYANFECDAWKWQNESCD